MNHHAALHVARCLNIFVFFSISPIDAVQSSTSSTDDATTYPRKFHAPIPVAAYTAYSKEDFPNPRTANGSALCGRPRISWVCDPGSKLLVAEADGLDDSINAWLSTSGCPCGKRTCQNSSGPFLPIFVGVIPRMIDGGSLLLTSSSQLTSIAEFAKYLRTEAGWGSGECGDTIIVLISIGDGVFWTYAGDHDVAGTFITHNCVDDIFQENRGVLSAGLYSYAIQNVVDEYISVMKGTRRCAVPPWAWWKIPAIIIGTILLYMLIADGMSRCLFGHSFFCHQHSSGSLAPTLEPHPHASPHHGGQTRTNHSPDGATNHRHHDEKRARHRKWDSSSSCEGCTSYDEKNWVRPKTPSTSQPEIGSATSLDLKRNNQKGASNHGHQSDSSDQGDGVGTHHGGVHRTQSMSIRPVDRHQGPPMTPAPFGHHYQHPYNYGRYHAGHGASDRGPHASHPHPRQLDFYTPYNEHSRYYSYPAPRPVPHNRAGDRPTSHEQHSKVNQHGHHVNQYGQD